MERYVAYIAGLFDGEGSVGIYCSGRGNYHLRTQLCQNRNASSEMVFNDLLRRFGGSVSLQSTRTNKMKLNWQLSGPKALRFLLAIRRYSILKLQQIRVAVTWQRQRQSRTRRNADGRFQKASFDTNAKRVSDMLKEMKG